MNAIPLVALFDERSQAQQPVREQRDAGFREEQIGLIARHTETRDVSLTEEEESKWAEGALAGGITGAGIGGLWALGIASGALPIIGPVIAGGLLASVLASAAGGAAVGGLLGALIGLGIPEEEARYYETEFRSGRTLVTVRADGRFEEAARILRSNGGSIRSDSTTPRSTVTPSPAAAFRGPTSGRPADVGDVAHKVR